jgi:hypothetical protein
LASSPDWICSRETVTLISPNEHVGVTTFAFGSPDNDFRNITENLEIKVLVPKNLNTLLFVKLLWLERKHQLACPVQRASNCKFAARQDTAQAALAHRRGAVHLSISPRSYVTQLVVEVPRENRQLFPH